MKAPSYRKKEKKSTREESVAAKCRGHTFSRQEGGKGRQGEVASAADKKDARSDDEKSESVLRVEGSLA